jgi:hypothetical protein
VTGAAAECPALVFLFPQAVSSCLHCVDLVRGAGQWMIRMRLVIFAAAVTTIFASGAAAAASIPWFGQKTNSDCGRAVLTSLAARRGGNAEHIYSRIPAPADQLRGYSVPEMRRAGARVGVSLAVRAPSGVVIAGECKPTPAISAYFGRLARSVASGHPVVIPVTSGGAGHYLLLAAASGTSFSVLDPASPGVRTMDTSALASAMCGFGYVALEAR